MIPPHEIQSDVGRRIERVRQCPHTSIAWERDESKLFQNPEVDWRCRCACGLVFFATEYPKATLKGGVE